MEFIFTRNGYGYLRKVARRETEGVEKKFYIPSVSSAPLRA